MLNQVGLATNEFQVHEDGYSDAAAKGAEARSKSIPKYHAWSPGSPVIAIVHCLDLLVEFILIPLIPHVLADAKSLPRFGVQAKTICQG